MAKDKKPKVYQLRGVTPVGMASFPNLFTPKKIKETDAEAKFRVTHVMKPKEFSEPNKAAFNKMIENVNEVCRVELHKTFTDFEGDDGTTYTAEGMLAEFEAALEEHKATPLKAHFAAFKALKWWDKKDQMVRSCRSPFLLGKNDDYIDNDAIFIRLSANSQFPPEVVNQSKEPLDEGDIYGGALIRCSYNAYPYNNMGNRGVTLYLGNVQKCGAGTRIGGGPSADQDFDEVPAEDVAF